MKRYCNVLMLALSTFPIRDKKDENGVILGKEMSMTESLFAWEDGTTYSGIYQLDPVPKMLSAQLKKEQDSLDKIILLCTRATLENREKVNISYLDDRKPEIFEGTAFDYFKVQTEPYMNPCVKEKFLTVVIDPLDLEKGITDTIQKLREIQDPRLYIDTHGGFREVFLIAEAVSSLLKIEGIDVKGIYGIQYGKENKIIDGSQGFQIFDFVSGMNEFINYGRIDSLERFLNTRMQYDIRGKQWQTDLIQCIRKISEGIQLCNIPVFEQGLEELTSFFEMMEPSDEISEAGTYLSIFIDNIKKDYGMLLTRNRTVVDEIVWCMRKGFYQQVLTLVESRIPGYLRDMGICSYQLGKKNTDTQVFNWCLPWRYHFKGWNRERRLNEMGKLWYPRSEKKYNNGKYVEDTSEGSWVQILIQPDKREILDAFFRMHLELKSLRNQSNHALEEIPSLSLSDVENKVSEYLILLKLIKTENFSARIRNITKKGNVMLELSDGMEGLKSFQCFLEKESDHPEWLESWKQKFREDSEKTYTVEVCRANNIQIFFRII